MNKIVVLLTASVILTGCMSTQHINGSKSKSSSSSAIDYDKASGGGRYTILQDHAPTGDIKVDHLPDLVPVYEPKSRGGNKSPYVVWGETYYVMDSAEGYVAEGTASWYGQKFHGHKTSNGETYDMYTFSAAHKSLPLPTYLKVTNLDNGQDVIVRVNDRGPFHGDRLIDLSYAAAARLGYHKKGLARVRIEAITPKPREAYSSTSPSNPSPVPTSASTPVPVPAVPSASASVPNTSAPVLTTSPAVTSAAPVTFTHLQLGAFSQQTSADGLKQKLFEQYDTTIKLNVVKSDDGLFKVVVGPFDQPEMLESWQKKLDEGGFGQGVKVAITP